MNWRTVAADALLAVAVVAGISVVIGAVESVSHVANISNLYIISIAILASRRGLYPALVASVLAFLAFDWFFIPPLHTFTVDVPSVLVVDDEAEVQTAIRRGLELMGYEIEVASDGAEGVAKVERWRPDVVLLDLAMPRMGGWSAIEQIRVWSKIPIIVLSSGALESRLGTAVRK